MCDALAVVQRYWQLMASNDFASVAAVLHPQHVLEWPQSGERIRGVDNFVRINTDYPAHGRWRFHLRRLFASGDQVVSEVDVSDGVQRARAITFFELRDGLIATQVEYWPDAYAAPQWRKPFCESIPDLLQQPFGE